MGMKGRFGAVVAAALAGGIPAGAHAQAINTDNGDVNITTDTTATSVWVGENNAGTTLSVGNFSTLTADSTTIGVNASATGNAATVTFFGKWTNSGGVDIGFHGGSNSLLVNNGGAFSAAGGRLGVFTGADGNSLTVSDAGAQMTLTGDLTVGAGSNSNTVTVSNGGSLSNANASVGYGSTGSNTATVTGAASKWTNGGTVYVGVAGASNTVTVSSGGDLKATSGDVVIGADSGASSNKITVDGPGSKLENDGQTLYVGRSGADNALQIQNGGVVTGKNARIGGGTGTNGPTSGNSASVDGPGSSWTLSGTLRVGSDGKNSSLQVTNSASVTVSGNTFVGYNASSTGNTVTVGDFAHVNLAGLAIGFGSTGNFVHVGENNATLSTTAIGITAGNKLQIDGYGTATTTGAFGMADGATLAFGFTYPWAHGHLGVGGLATLNGTLDVEELDAFTFPETDSYIDLISFDSVTGDFTGMSLNGFACAAQGADAWVCGTHLFTEEFTGTSFGLNVAATPELSTWAMMGVGFATLAFAGQRARRRTVAA